MADPTGTNLTSGAAGEIDNSSPIDKKYVLGQRTRNLRADVDATGTMDGTTLTLNPANTTSGTVNIPGHLTVQGTTTTINSATMTVDDPNIELNSVGSPSDANANGGGITLKGTTDKTIAWIDATDAWTLNNRLALSDPDVAHGCTNVAATDSYGDMGPIHGTQGGLMINGLSDQESASARSLALRGICDDNHTDSVPLVEIIGAKRSGTTVQALAAAETVLEIANHTTALMTVLGSGNVGVGTTTPGATLDVRGGNIALTDADVATGITGVAATEAYGDMGPIHGTRGGLMINGISDQESADARSLALRGISNDTHTDTVPLVEIIGAKRSGTSIQALAAAETVLEVANHTTTLMTVLGSGNVGMGVVDPDAQLEVFDTGTQLKLSFDGTDNATFAVDTNGFLTVTPSGGRLYTPAIGYKTLIHATKTNGQTVTAGESGGIFAQTGVATTPGNHVVNLPATAAGLTYTFWFSGTAGHGFHLNPASGDKFMGNLLTEAGGVVVLGTNGAGTDDRDLILGTDSDIGHFITVVGNGSTGWMVTNSQGDWSSE